EQVVALCGIRPVCEFPPTLSLTGNSYGPQRLIRIVMKRSVCAVKPVDARGSANIERHRIFERFGGMLDSPGNPQHLVWYQSNVAARQVEAPTALEHEDHLFVFMTVGVRNSAALNLDFGYCNAFADSHLSLIEVSYFFRFHSI